MNGNDKDIWFPAKKYGIGWGLPVAWQGWVVLFSYIALVVVGGLFLDHYPWLVIPFIIYVLIISGLLIFICWKKGEKSRWRWGKKP